MVVVEVRQESLGGDDRAGGPAGNTGRGCRGGGPAGIIGRGYSRLRSGREHWAGIFAVEVRQKILGGDGRG